MLSCYTLIEQPKCSLTDTPIILLGPEETMHKDNRSMLRVCAFWRFMEIECEGHTGYRGVMSKRRSTSLDECRER